MNHIWHHPPLQDGDDGYYETAVGTSLEGCHARGKGHGYVCTRLKGHDGPHAAHGTAKIPQHATWTEDDTPSERQEGP